MMTTARLGMTAAAAWTTIVLLALAAHLAAASVEPAESDAAPATQPDEMFEVIDLPLDDGHVDFGEVLAELIDRTGLNGDGVREAVQWRANVRGAAGKLKLEAIEKVTRGIVSFAVTDEALRMTIDQARWRQHVHQLRHDFRGFLETWFPEAAARAKARFGMKVHLRDGRAVSPDQAILTRRAVVLVHGLDDPGKVWRHIRPKLLREGYTICELTYPNDQSIVESAAFMAEQLELLRQGNVETISIVAHSMGGLVSREVLTSDAHYGGRGDGGNRYPRVERLIMIGTPNHGSPLAKLRIFGEMHEHTVRLFTGQGMLFGSFFDGAGQAADDLMPDSPFLKQLNARPHPVGVHYTIVAGNASPVTIDGIDNWRKRVPDWMPDVSLKAVDEIAEALGQVVTGLGDGAVPLKSTVLESVDDYTVVKANHLSIVRNMLDRSQRIIPAIPIVLDRLSKPVD